MQRTIDLPDELAQSLDAYLREHPNETISSLIQAALTIKLALLNLDMNCSRKGKAVRCGASAAGGFPAVGDWR